MPEGRAREIDSLDAAPGLESGELDLAFARIDDELVNGISSFPVMEDRPSVALLKDHPLASIARIRLKLLSAEQLVMSSREVSPLYFNFPTNVCRTPTSCRVWACVSIS